MSVIKGLETTFNEVAESYDKMRPSYVKELYDDIFKYKTITKDSNVLEIGIGTGQATLPILKTGCSLTAVELGDKLTAFTAKKFSGYDNFTIINSSFQDFKSTSSSFDFIYSASAFHWIPEEIGYTKVYDMLKPGGVFARFANHPYKDKEKEQLDIAFQKLYAEYMPYSKATTEYTEARAQSRAEIGSKYGFINIKYKLYKRTRTFTSNQYLLLLATYSDHIALNENIRKIFFNKIRSEIDRFGGSITLYDTLDLQLYRKP